ncbi:MAG: glycine zipper domain-containing protein [Roseateles sp.]
MNTIAAPSPRSASAYWRISVVALAAATLLALSGCAGMSARETSTVVGATAGAVVGGVVTGTTAGAAVGAAAGGVIGNELSKKRNR